MAEQEIYYASIPHWCSMTGMSRSTVYREIANKNLKIIKLGKKTLVDVKAGLSWMKTLPAGESRVALRNKLAA